jgi:hypothetical protein
MGASPTAIAAVRLMLAPVVRDGSITLFPIDDWAATSTFSLYMRYALTSDPEGWAQWQANPPVSVWSVSPAAGAAAMQLPRKSGPGTAPAGSFGAPQLIKKLGYDESYLNGAADALMDALQRWAVANYPTAVIRRGGSGISLSGASSNACIAARHNCGGDNRDTTYIMALPHFSLPSDGQSLAFVVGASHRLTGNAFYSNVAVYDASRKLGVVAAVDTQFEGSASAWLNGSAFAALAPKLYVVALSRSCPAGLPFVCLVVPSSGFPSVPEGHELSVVERPYCSQMNTVGPSGERVLKPRLLLTTAR